MVTGMICCDASGCLYNKESDCRLKEIGVSSGGMCYSYIATEKEEIRTFVESDECNRVEMLSSQGEWIQTQFKFIKKGFRFKLFAGEQVVVNDEWEFCADTDAFETDKSGKSVYRINICP